MSSTTAFQELHGILAMILSPEDLIRVNGKIHERPELQAWLNMSSAERHQIMATRVSQPGSHRPTRVA